MPISLAEAIRNQSTTDAQRVWEEHLRADQTKRSGGVKPSECPHCEYDRRFPGFEAGGWMQQPNNGPIVPCPLCNDSAAYPRD